MKRKYFIPFSNDKERDRIRRWTGVTSGVSLTLKTALWDSWDNAYEWEAGWYEGYVITVTKPQAEMLLKLQFIGARTYNE